jgi:hypothetical protein
MDRFVISLPKASHLKKKIALSNVDRNLSGSKRIIAEVSPVDDQKENKLATFDDDLAQRGSSHGSSSKRLQMYLDFGQKSLNETVQCPRCQLLFMKHDLEDLKQHERFCQKTNAPPQLSQVTIQSLSSIFEWPKDDERIVVIKKRNQKRKSFSMKDQRESDNINSTIFKMQGIIKLIEIMKSELGAVDNYVITCSFLRFFVVLISFLSLNS